MTLATRVRTLWVDSSASEEKQLTGIRSTFLDPWASIIFWPLAVVLVLHRVFFLALRGGTTDDFSTVYFALRRFLDGQPVYGETYYFVDPHYLYNPGATLVLSPLALLGDNELARIGFIILNALAILTALALLTKLFDFSLHGAVFPLSIVVAFATEAVTNTLVFANINGILLLALVCYIQFLHEDRRWRAGIIIGLAILIKPVFAPLLLLPLVKVQWQTLVAGMAVPIVANLIAWPFTPGANDYLTRTMPYLGQVRDYANSSFPGLVTYFGLPTWLELVALVGFGSLIAIAVVMLLRVRYSQPLLWLSTTTGVLLAGAFLLSSLGQMYYSMMFFPLIFAATLPNSPINSITGWLGICLSLLQLDWTPFHQIATFQATVGWAFIIIAVGVYYLGAHWPIMTSTNALKKVRDKRP